MILLSLKIVLFVSYVNGEFLQMIPTEIDLSRVIKNITGVTITACYMECSNNERCDSFGVTQNFESHLQICHLMQKSKNSTEVKGKSTILQGTELITKPSAVNGGFSAWKETTSCSSTCGIGNVTYTRSCDDPKPLYGGEDCCGKRVKTEPCLLRYCEVCYGAKNDDFAEFKVWKTGQLNGIRLIHISGSLHCNSKYVARWGCPKYGKHSFSVVVTNAEKKVLFPEQIEHRNYYVIKDAANNDNEITFSKAHPINIFECQKLRIWDYEDLINLWEANNFGQHCIYIQLIYKD